MTIVGLTGGIGAGKTTVARILVELGVSVIDADKLARWVVRPGSEELRSIVDLFGREVLDNEGVLDRGALARRVFNDPAQRKRLEAIVHPAIEAAFRSEVTRLEQANVDLVVYDAALLVETGRYRQMDWLIVVIADDDVRAHRLRGRDGISESELNARIAAQLPQAQKAQLADFVIDNSGSLAETREQVEAVWREISGRGQ